MGLYMSSHKAARDYSVLGWCRCGFFAASAARGWFLREIMLICKEYFAFSLVLKQQAALETESISGLRSFTFGFKTL